MALNTIKVVTAGGIKSAVCKILYHVNFIG